MEGFGAAAAEGITAALDFLVAVAFLAGTTAVVDLAAVFATGNLAGEDLAFALGLTVVASFKATDFLAEPASVLGFVLFVVFTSCLLAV